MQVVWYLHVQPKGSRWWRLRYRFVGKGRKMLSLGTYPSVSLKVARLAQDDVVKSQLAHGLDLSCAKKRAKRQVLASQHHTHAFVDVAREWFANERERWTARYAAQVLRQLERGVSAFWGACPVAGIKAAERQAVIRNIEGRGGYSPGDSGLMTCGAAILMH